MMMNSINNHTFPSIYEALVKIFSEYWEKPWTNRVQQVPVSTWHAQPTDMPSIELSFVSYEVEVPFRMESLVKLVNPNLPWAEDHFLERVSGKPLNPPPSEQWWPFAQQSNIVHKSDNKFSHTYPERYWPKMANVGEVRPNGRQVFVPHNGIRYEYGDLSDVVKLLMRDTLTRQAYLPVWFPEDTGAVDGQRVPCSMGYHFMVRQGKLYCTYHMRSCDFLRHWADDMYLTARLMQWIAGLLQVGVGSMICLISSLHVFEGDKFKILSLMAEVDDFYGTSSF